MSLSRRPAPPRPRRRAASGRATHLRTIALAGIVVLVAIAAARGSVGGLTAFRTQGQDQEAEAGSRVPGDATGSDPGVVATPARKQGEVKRRYVVVEGTLLKQLPEETRRSRLADRVERLPGRKADSTSIPAFTVAMLNILGSNHSQGPGGFGPGASRAYTATRLLLSRGASIIGFSEIQRDQLGVFTRNAPAFDVYPGDAVGPRGVPQSLAWDTNVWELKVASTFSIPFNGQGTRPQPVVRLSHVETGNDVWVVNIHNSPQGMQAERDRASAIEIEVINGLLEDGIPVILTGDFNEKAEAMCRFTSALPLVSAVGGTSEGGVCRPPPRPRVDWIFASPGFDQESFLVTRAAPVPRITDHAALFSTLSHP